MMKNCNAFTLIEVLLSTVLVGLFLSAMVFSMGSVMSDEVRLEYKVDAYTTLERYIKANSSLAGKKAKLTVENKKIHASIENKTGEFESIPTLEPQIEDLNKNAEFLINVPSIENIAVTNVTVFLPDGSYEENNPVIIGLEEKTNAVQVLINEYGRCYISDPILVNNEEDDVLIKIVVE